MAANVINQTRPLIKHYSRFLALSPELRNAIYEYAIDWPDLSGTFERIISYHDYELDQEGPDSPPLCTFPRPHFGVLDTPSILILNKQIAFEAREILYTKPLILESPPPYIPQLAKPMDITEFISETTLQNIRFVVLKMDLNQNPNLNSGGAKCWLKTVEMLLDIWCVKNNLERLEVHAHYVPPSKAMGWTFRESAHHRHVISLLSRVSDVSRYLEC